MNWLIIMSRKRFSKITRELAKDVGLTAWNAGREYQYQLDKGLGIALAGVPDVWTKAFEGEK